MEFAITLGGAAWEEELKQQGWSATDAVTWTRPVELAIVIGEARHPASVPLVVDAKNR